MIKVRFAPSPTGYLHIGGARTALFNWMYAKAQGGQFVLRIEDTDQVRSKQEFLDEILESMQWLGMDWDDIFYQSKRFDTYKEYAEKLVDEGKAYKDGEAILLKMHKTEIKLYDLIRGEITFDTANFTVRNEDGSTAMDEKGEPVLKDEVLIKNDGSPAYSFCCVVDDALMEITCVVRGEDHISNTPKQILMYQALGFKPPKFAHLPLIMGEDGGRLSKRTGAVAVTDYRQNGFLSEAVVNYLMLLGWSPGNNQEMIGLSSAIKKFSIKKINSSAAVFSMEKLTWLNSEYIKQMETKKLVDILISFLEQKGIALPAEKSSMEGIVKLFQKRLPTLEDFIKRAGFLFSDEYEVDQEAKEKYLAEDLSKEFNLLAESLNSLSEFSIQNTEKAFRALADELGRKTSELVHPIRIALSGSTVGPGLFETMAVLGKEKTVERLLKAYK